MKIVDLEFWNQHVEARVLTSDEGEIVKILDATWGGPALITVKTELNLEKESGLAGKTPFYLSVFKDLGDVEIDNFQAEFPEYFL